MTLNDAAALKEDVTLLVSGNVLANDSDVDPGTVLNVAAPGTYTGAYGTLVLGADGSYNYTLNNGAIAVQSLAAGQSAIDAFGYAASDGIVNTAGTLTLTIAGTNDAPIANPNAVGVLENATTANLVAMLLANDTDVDVGDTRSITAVNATGTCGNCDVRRGQRRSLTYAANGATLDALRAGVTSTDSFTYTIADAAGATFNRGRNRDGYRRERCPHAGERDRRSGGDPRYGIQLHGAGQHVRGCR